MSIWYHFEDISHSTICVLSILFKYHGLIKSKFNKFNSTSEVNHYMIAYQREDSIGEFLWDDFRERGPICPWGDFSGFKYSERNIKSINIIVVYITSIMSGTVGYGDVIKVKGLF